MGTARKKRVTKKKKKPTWSSLEFEITDYNVSTSIHLKEPGVKFKDLRDDEKLWEQATYIKCIGKRIGEDSEGEALSITIYIKDHARLFEETKGDYAVWEETDDQWRRQRKTRTRQGREEHVYRDFMGFGHCNRSRYADGEQVWDFMIDMTPPFAIHVLHMLEMDKRSFMTTYVSKNNRYYQMLRIGFTNDAEDVVGTEPESQA